MAGFSRMPRCVEHPPIERVSWSRVWPSFTRSTRHPGRKNLARSWHVGTEEPGERFSAFDELGGSREVAHGGFVGLDKPGELPPRVGQER